MIVPVTRPEYDKGKSVFAGASEYQFTSVATDEASVAEAVRSNGCRAVVLGVENYVGPLYESLPEGGIILRFGIGTDGIDLGQAKHRGIAVANTPGVLDRSVAEHCIFLIGALARHVAQCNEDLRLGKWMPRTGDELGDLKLAIVGLGAIGTQVALIAHQGFNMETLICHTHRETSVANRLGIDQSMMRARLGYSTWSETVDDVLPQADIVTVHLPLREDTVGFFDERRFARFKTGSLFVNTARGALVVESDLALALDSGKLAGAALDVYQNEPYQPSESADDLRRFPNVLMTPHIGSNTVAANRLMAKTVIDNLRHWAHGENDAVHMVT